MKRARIRGLALVAGIVTACGLAGCLTAAAAGAGAGAGYAVGKESSD
jgi:hypothetical protein